MVRAHVKARELGVHLVCGAQVTVAAPGARLAASPVSVGLHHGAGPGWGIDTDELPPDAATTGRRGRTKRAKPRQVQLALEAAEAEPAAPSRIVLLATDRAGWANLVRL